MSLDYLIALFTFIFVANITPGPNKMLLVVSGVNFGWRRTLPQIFGIAAGISLTIFSVGLGIAKIFERYPASYTAIKWAGVVYMLYLAWKTAHATPNLSSPNDAAAPIGFWQATAMQALNPKAWAIGVISSATYVPQVESRASMPHLVLVALGFFSLSIFTSLLWTGFGVQLRQWLRDPRHLRLFNWTMALALLLSVLPML